MSPRKKKTLKKKVEKTTKAKKALKSKKTAEPKKPRKATSAKKTAKIRKTLKKRKPKAAKKPAKTKKKKATKKTKKVEKQRASRKGKKVSTKTKVKTSKKGLLKTNQSEQYQKALKEFGRAVHEFNRRGFTEAKQKLLEIIKKYPQEQELSENARTYIRICDKHIEKRSPRPRELDDFYNHGVIQLNNQNFKEAIKFFDKAISFDSKNEKVLYAKAAALALNGNKEEALSSLKAAIKYEPQNRIRAKGDPDFDSLRTDSEFIDLIEPSEEIE